MRYLPEGFWLLLAALAAGLALYAPLYFWLRKRGLRDLLRHGAHWLFTAYLLFLLALLFSPVHPLLAAQRSVNFIPFDAFTTTLRYDISVAMTQYVLNILLFIPGGLLLPVVFPRLRRLPAITGVLAAFIVAVESLQYMLGRVADIDDVLTNLMGGLTGWSLFVLLDGWLGRRVCWRRLIPSPVYTKGLRKAAVALILLTWAPAATALAIDTFSEFAPLPAGIRLPADTTVSAPTGDLPATARVYGTISMSSGSMDDTVTAMQQTFNVYGEYRVSQQGVQVSDSAGGRLLVINNDGTWRILFFENRPVTPPPEGTDLPDDDACRTLARNFLTGAGVDTGRLQVESITDIEQTFPAAATGDDDAGEQTLAVIGRQVVLVDTSGSQEHQVTGQLVVQIRYDGAIISGSDERLVHIPLREVPLRPLEDAIAQAQREGYRDPGMVSLNIASVALDYAVETRKHHLQPVWRLTGTATMEDGSTQPFETILPAMG